MSTPIPAGFVAPFRADDLQIYIFDANGRMAADLVMGFPRPRGWGRIQYLDNGSAQMDEWKTYFYEAQGRAEDTSVEALIEALNNPPE